MSHEVWVVDDDRSIRWVLEKAISQADMHVTCFETADKLIRKLATEQPDVVISDIRMPGMDGLTLLDKIKEHKPNLPVIIMTAFADLDKAVAAFKGGAFEYLPKPFDVDEAVSIVQRAVKKSREVQDTSQEQESPDTISEIIGAAPAMQEVFRAIGRLSRANINILLTGESGTGKELVARALHLHSPRADKPFIALNTAAIPRDLLESELFGHEKGAFTGASSQRIGRFEQADNGTLFLDEIGDMPAELQTRLLRVLADGMFYRVGGHVPIKVNVRVIAATHQDLELRVRNGDFREDLFHRLNVIRLHIPPLRDRKEDIPLLIEHFLPAAAEELEVEPKHLTPEVVEFFNSLDWPGNVRQLENICRWITVMAPAQEVHVADLPQDLKRTESYDSAQQGDWQGMLRVWAERHLASGETDLLHNALPTFERIMIESAMNKTGGRRQEAAILLGWGRNTLTRKIKELEMDI